MLPPYNDFFKVGVSSAGNHDNNIYNQPDLWDRLSREATGRTLLSSLRIKHVPADPSLN